MRKLLLTLVVLLFSVSLAFSQTQRSDYKKIDYLWVSQDSDWSADGMKATYEDLVESGDLKNWALYRVNYPGGKRSDYNYISVATSSEIKVFEMQFSESDSPFYVPSAMDQNSSAGENPVTLIASEIWKVRSVLPTDSTTGKPSKFMVMDYMSVSEGNGPSYLTLEDEVAMPLHRERYNNGTMAGWEVYSLVLPGGTEYGYSFATGNYFDHIADIEFGFTRELINKTLPGRDVRDLLNTIYETRDLVKSEVWALESYAQ